MILLSELIDELELIAPPDLADDGDPIGLQIGDAKSEISKICVALDCTQSVISKAIESGANALVTHHPLIFHPLKSLDFSNPIASRVVQLVRSNVAFYAMHTNYDTVFGGINDALAKVLGVNNTEPLTSRKEYKFYKIAVFVPEEAVEKVRNAMADAGAGRIGQYTHCSFWTAGTGSFVPLPAAQPYIGSAGKLEEVDEYRLEMICPEPWLEYVLDEMIEKHPYDEVAYDLYELANEPMVYGYGRVGLIDKEMTLKEFSKRVAERLKLKYIRVEGNPDKIIKRVAMCGGSGSSLFKDALKMEADVYVTGDTKHHDRLDADSLGLAMIDAGHFETEKPGVVALAENLKKILKGKVNVEYIE